jgi:hypothetical protein
MSDVNMPGLVWISGALVALAVGCGRGPAAASPPDGSPPLDAGSAPGPAPLDAGSAPGADATVPPEGGDAPTGRRCDPSASAAQGARWERLATGFDDFLVTTTPPVPGDDADALGFAGVAFGNGTWVLVGGGDNPRASVIRFATSSDGVSWQSGSFTPAYQEIGMISRVFFVRDQFVFFAAHDTRSPAKRPVLYTSPDGRTWTGHPLPTAIPLVFDAASDGARVVLAAGNLWSSTDFETWTETTFATGAPRAGITSIAFGSGRWVASGVESRVEGSVLREDARAWGSADGVEWQLIDLTGNGRFNVVHRDGVWLASNIAREHRTSADGMRFDEVVPTGTWPATPGTFEPLVRAVGARFLATIVDDTEVPPSAVRLIASADGVAWHDFGSVAGLPLPAGAITIEYAVADIAYADCRAVAAGSYRVIVPGALDPPLFWNETGPFVITADLAR